MKRRRILVGLVFVVTALGAFAGGAAVVVASQRSARPRARAARAPAQTLSISCRSPSLGGSLPAMVYLPAGYSRHSSPYPVIYFLHGLPANPDSYKTYGFVAGAVSKAGLRAIVVTPQGARADNSDREYLDWSSTENWPQAIAHDLTTCIDGRFDTIRNRFGRALMGLSAGGYGAFNIGLRNLQTFAAVESWSGYFVATDPSGEQVLNLGSTQANDDAMAPRGTALVKSLGTWPSMIGFYVGRQDSRFLTMNEQYDQSLTQSGVAHLFQIYSGGHSEALWRAPAPPRLGLALSYLAAGERARGKSGGSPG
jgi:enterochelin esterase-like enzyme